MPVDQHAWVRSQPFSASRAWVVAVCCLAMVVGWVPTSASAQDVSTSNRARILGDATHERVTVRLSNGSTARGNLIRYREDSEHLSLRTRLGQATIAGTERFEPMQRREFERRQAIGGVNGGYFLDRPHGAPNGLHVQDGTMSQTQAVRITGVRALGRAALGMRPDGRLAIDRIDVRTQLTLPEATGDTRHTVDEVNRRPHSGSDEGLLLYDDRYGTTVSVAAGRTVLTVAELQVTSSGNTRGRVEQVRRLTSPTAVSVPAGRHLIVGDTNGTLAGVAVGHRPTVRTRITPDATSAELWQDLASGAAGGQLLIRGGTIRNTSEHCHFSAFGNDPCPHVNARRARTAIGRTSAGQAMLLTIDERNSAGVTVPELARVMASLGASDAVNMDGGGPTHMAVGGRVVNQPSDPNRGNSTGIFLHAPPAPAPRPLSAACDGARPSPFLDVRGNTHEEAIHCLAHWGLASGRTATSYEPAAPVTRAQMATFLANLVDDVAARGSGRALPTTSRHPFTDIRGNVHEDAIARLHAAGVINGVDVDRYAPGTTISRDQTAALVARAVNYVDQARDLPRGRDHFLDDNASVHEDAIDRLARQGIVSGTSGLEFSPRRDVRRDAMASLVMRAADLLVERGLVASPS